MNTIILDKAHFWSKIGNIYDMLQKDTTTGFVVIPKEVYDKERISQTTQNNISYEDRKSEDYFTLDEMKLKYGI